MHIVIIIRFCKSYSFVTNFSKLLNPHVQQQWATEPNRQAPVRGTGLSALHGEDENVLRCSSIQSQLSAAGGAAEGQHGYIVVLVGGVDMESYVFFDIIQEGGGGEG